MTLIAVRTTSDKIELIADSISYSPSYVELIPTNKVHLIPRLNVMITARGDGYIRRYAQFVADSYVPEEPGVEPLAAYLNEKVKAEWEFQLSNEESGPSETFYDIAICGYSEEQGSMATYALTSLDGADLLQMERMFVAPSPLEFRPGSVETLAWQQTVLASSDTTEELRDGFAQWFKRPLCPEPNELEEWVALADLARTSRALGNPHLKALIGGELIYARLDREGSFVTGQLHAWPMTDEEDLKKMVTPSLHRLAQWEPCPCESNKPLVECCYAPLLDEPCECRSGKPFRDCHLVERPA